MNVNKVQTLIRKYATRTVMLQKELERKQGYLKKIAELEETVAELTDSKEAAQDAKEAADAAVKAVTKGVEVATSENTDAMSESAKNAIIEAVTRVDQEAGTQLSEAIDDAEKIDSEKLSGMMIDVFRSIETKGSTSFGTRSRSSMSKSASLNSVESRFDDAVDALVHY